MGIVGMTILGAVLTGQRGDPLWLFLGLPVALALLLLGRLAPIGYRLGADGVHILRRAGPRIIPYRAIRGVDREARPLKGLTVTGSNGVFGRFGRFWNMRLGFYRLYVANNHGIVWLATDEGWVGLSPDRPGEFVERLASRLAILGRGEEGRGWPLPR